MLTHFLSVIPLDMVSPEYAAQLFGLGYRGIAGDGMDALIVPTDVAIAHCLTDTDCAVASGAVDMIPEVTS